MPLTQVSSRLIEDTLRYVLGASGTNHYTFTGKGLTGAVNDPTLTLSRGHTYIFENRNSANAHPFYIKTSIANGGTNDAYNTGVTNNGGAGGTEIVFTVPHDAPDLLYYQCSSHSSMAGQLKIAGAVADGSITTAKLAADAVDGTKIADDAINSEHYVDGSIDTAHIADGAVTNAKLADNAVTNGKIAASTIITADIADNQITTAKIADLAVTDAKINGMAASKLTGALPAISGAALTNLPGGGKLLQIVQDTKKSQGSSSSHSTNVAISGLSVSITPSASTSKVLVLVTLTHGFSSTSSFVYRLLRDSTALNVGTTDPGSPVSGYVGTVAGKQNSTRGQPVTITFLDEPNTTSSITYSLTIKHNSGTWYLNTRDDNYGGASSIQAIEIGA
jgi:hypothetical protein